MEEKVPKFLYKILSIEQWQASLQSESVVTGELDAAFIHLAKEEQLEHVIQKFWEGKEYVLLKLDAKELEGRLVFETNPGGVNKYYHLYEGSIPLSAIVVAEFN